jgi:hypothetical protein
MLKVENLHAGIAGTPVLKRLTLAVSPVAAGKLLGVLLDRSVG